MKKVELDYSKLRGRIVEKFGSCSAFAKFLGIKPQQLNPKLTGKTAITKKDILEWSKVLGISTEEIGVFFYTLKV